MRAYLLSLILLIIVAFSLATALDPWYQSWGGSRVNADNFLQVALGDGRRLFARQFFVKADAYLHQGYYPTIYDDKEGFERAHNTEGVHSSQGGPVQRPEHENENEHEEDAEDFLGPPRDWIDAFSRSFFPSRHTHLEGDGREREILPWLQLSLELDPDRIETYSVAAYWLRARLQRIGEAEQVLRQGLRRDPGNPQLLFELGQIYFEERHQAERARNVWELALRNCRQRDAKIENPDLFLFGQLLANLATLEEKEHHLDRTLKYLEELVPITPNRTNIEFWIKSLRAQ